MTMTHKEALTFAAAKSIVTPGSTCIEDDLDVAIRAYVEARGLVLMPKEATGEMRAAGESWSALPGQTWDDMIDAAPDPFKDDAL